MIVANISDGVGVEKGLTTYQPVICRKWFCCQIKYGGIIKMRNEKGFVLVLALMFIVVLTLIGLASMNSSIYEIKLAGNDLQKKQAFLNAESGVAVFSGKIKHRVIVDDPSNINWTFTLNESVGDDFGSFSAIGSYRIEDGKIVVVDGYPVFKVVSTGMKNKTTQTVEATMVRKQANPKTWAAVTANGSVNTIGNFTADGRDWDENGVVPLLNGQGAPGISTKAILNLGGSSSVGGTVNGVDYAPSSKGLGNLGVAVENPNQPLMTSPDNALGLSEGTLKGIAQSKGTYYPIGSTVPSPISGVTYVEGDFATVDGEGVLIVTGTLGNFHGNFKGIVIANCVNKINGNSGIVGTLITMTSAFTDVLNGTADIKFSRARMQKSLDSVSGMKLVTWRHVF